MVGILLSYWGPAYFQGLWLLVSGSVDGQILDPFKNVTGWQASIMGGVTGILKKRLTYLPLQDQHEWQWIAFSSGNQHLQKLHFPASYGPVCQYFMGCPTLTLIVSGGTTFFSHKSDSSARRGLSGQLIFISHPIVSEHHFVCKPFPPLWEKNPPVTS